MNPDHSILITGCSSGIGAARLQGCGDGAAAGNARFPSRDFRLTDVHGNVFHEIIA